MIELNGNVKNMVKINFKLIFFLIMNYRRDMVFWKRDDNYDY
jgi:hypothetical protein